LFKKKFFFHLLTRWSAFFAIGLIVEGCYLEVEEPLHVQNPLIEVDLDLSWRISGAESSTLCASYGIDYWVLEVEGQSVAPIDCETSPWQQMVKVFERRNRIAIRAFNQFQQEIASQSTMLNVHASDFITHLQLEFYSSDFGL
jgi:hypothetical protein